MRNSRKTKYDTTPLVQLITSSLKHNGGIPQLERLAQMKEGKYYSRNRKPDTYQIGELRDIMIAFNISKVRLLHALVVAFDIPVEAINAVAVLIQAEKK